jgi:hypothetical protein
VAARGWACRSSALRETTGLMFVVSDTRVRYLRNRPGWTTC